MNTEKRIEVERKIVAFDFNTMSKQSPLDARCSPWPWSQVAAMSSVFTFNIKDSEGYLVAKVLCVDDDTDAMTQSYANARVLQIAPEMAQALRLIHEVLTGHPEAGTGSGRVHSALMTTQAMLNKMEKKR